MGGMMPISIVTADMKAVIGIKTNKREIYEIFTYFY